MSFGVTWLIMPAALAEIYIFDGGAVSSSLTPA